MKKLFPLLFFPILLLVCTDAFAQPGLKQLQSKYKKESSSDEVSFKLNTKNNSLGAIVVPAKLGLRQADAQAWLGRQLQLRTGIDVLMPDAAKVISGNMSIEKFRQYFKGIKVEHGLINAATINGKLSLVQAEFYSIPANLATTPSISEDAALTKAMQYIGAKKYGWEVMKDKKPVFKKPTGELVIIKDITNNSDSLYLAYKFGIVATEPAEKSFVYINATNGKMVYKEDAANSLNEDNTSQRILSPLATAENKILTDIGSKVLAYTNTAASAATLYSGTQTIYTDAATSVIPPFATYYRLRQTKNGHDIVVQNYGNRNYNNPTNNTLASDITDDDNDWTPAGVDSAALEVMFNMQVWSDYWKTTQDRTSYDNAGATVNGYVHADVGRSCAVWDPFFASKSMYFGDGHFDGTSRKELSAHVGLDILGHEMGHAMVRSTGMPNFVQGGEPGALNEGLSDIWGVCVENYALTKFPTSNVGNNKELWLIGEQSINSFETKGLRDLINPKTKEQPDTYYGAFFLDNIPGNDFVHVNSSVLGKWFSLITAGGNGTNDHGYTYTIPGLGFGITDSIVYNTELLLTANANYIEMMHSSINYVTSVYKTTRPDVVTTITEAWRAVGVLDTVFYPNTTNTVFGTNNSFTCVGVGKDGHVWAGTSGKGLYKFDGTTWRKYSDELGDSALLGKVSYRDIKADRYGGIWIAQTGYSGVSGNSNSSGGVYYFTDTAFTSKHFYTSTPVILKRNTISRNVTSLWVDNSRDNAIATVNGKVMPQVWITSLAQTTASANTSGGVAMGLTDTIYYSKYFANNAVTYDSNFMKVATPYLTNVDNRTEQRGAQTVGGNSQEVWTYSDVNNEKSLLSWGFGDNYYNGSPKQIMRFSALTGDSIGVYNNSNAPKIPATFTARAIYFDVNNNKWLGLTTGGTVMLDKDGNWHSAAESLILPGNGTVPASVTEAFPIGTIVNNNAITGDDNGIVYIGTTNGLVVYSGTEPAHLDDYHYYKRYTTADGLPSNTIRGIAIDKDRKGVWLATDNGVVLWRFEGPERALTITEVDANACNRDISFRLKTKGKFFGTPAKNDMIIQLSDANGSFASPTVLKTFPNIVTNDPEDFEGTVVQVPESIPNGNGYMLRTVSTNPAFIGSSSRPFAIQKVITTVPSAASTLITANLECTDELGWTHYYFDNNTPADPTDDVRLLSLEKGSNNIGEIGDGTFKVEVGTTAKAGTFSATPVNNPIITNPFISMNRYWQVTPTAQPTTSVGVRFYYNTQDLADLNGGIVYGPVTHTNLVFYKTNGNPNPASNLANTTVLYSYINGATPSLTEWTYTQLGSTIHQAEFKVPGFSGGGGGSTPDNGPLSASPLPLTLVSFNARVNNNGTLLQWKTSTEINTSRFEIQRSIDGVRFVTIATVAAAGNSNTERSYATTDSTPVNGKNYYRLKMIDKDGKTTYSEIRLITFTKGGLLVSIYPNPVKNILTIESNFKGKMIQVMITDVTGRKVMNWSAANNAIIQLPVNHLGKGTYIVQLTDGEATANKKLVKE